MRSFRCSSNKITGGNIIFRYALPTAVGMLILSFAIKTAGQIFYLISAVLFIVIGYVLSSVFAQRKILFCALLLSLFCIRILSVLTVTVEKSYDNNLNVDSITAIVTNTPDYYTDGSNYGSCTVKIEDSERGLISKGSLLLLYGEDVALLDLGDTVNTQVRLSAFDDKTRFSYYSENVFLKGECIEPVFAKSTSKGIYGFAGLVNEYVKTHLVRNTDNYGMLMGIITGEKSYISDEFYEQVKIAGVSHILVVSGMHLAILCGLIIKILRPLKIPELTKDLLLLVFLFLMMCVCGFSMSMLRASIVYVFAILYRRMKRLGDSMLYLGNAVIIILFIHPFAVHSVAFQLSFASTFGILVLANRIIEYFNRKNNMGKIYKYVVQAASTSLSAYVATLPVVIYNFGYISTYAVPTNIILSLPSTLMLILGVVGTSLVGIPFLGKTILYFADLIADFFVSVVKFVCKLPLSAIRLKNEELLAILILILMFTLYMVKRKPYRIFFRKR